MHRLPLFSLVACLATPAIAQQDASKCATVTVSTAAAKDLPALIGDAECFGKAAASASNSQVTRLKKARELATSPVVTPPPAPPAPPPPAPPPPPASAYVPDSWTESPAIIPSNFDVASQLVPSWGTGDIPVSAKPDVVGAFRFSCGPGQLLYDDPVVYPGQPGKSHLHQFFGNTAANGKSTYKQLRTEGESTCMNVLNRSSYWMPAMLDGHGNVVRPDYINIYYKRRPKTDPQCQIEGKACVDLPRGLRYVFGQDMMKPASEQIPNSLGYFNCDGPTAKPGHYSTLVEAAKNCPVEPTMVNGSLIYNRIGAVINAPNCWNGKDLDSADHRSHMAYQSYGWWGYPKCPDTHPYVIASFTMGSWYTVDSTLAATADWKVGDTLSRVWHLSSDRTDAMFGMDMGIAPPGTRFHADWFGAWDDATMAMWEGNCIDKLLNCSGGDLGNGKQLRMFAGFSWKTNPHKVPMPERP